jgi:PAS domain-containing protein
MVTQGVIIMDLNRRIRLFTPGAEELLGWQASQVAGLACTAILACQGPSGESLCPTCRVDEALARQELTPGGVMRMADPAGTRHDMATVVWYLPPLGSVGEPRAMVVISGKAPEERPIPPPPANVVPE